MAGSGPMEDDDISSVMGFSGFGKCHCSTQFDFLSTWCYQNNTGKQKTSKKFNLEEMFEVSRRTAQQYSAQVKGKLVRGAVECS